MGDGVSTPLTHIYSLPGSKMPSSMAARTLLFSIIGAAIVVGYAPLKTFLTTTVTGQPTSSAWIIAILFASVAFIACLGPLEPVLKFAWSCFFQPLGKTGSQQDRLDKFYRGQADGE
jgi:hypothetical protein